MTKGFTSATRAITWVASFATLITLAMPASAFQALPRSLVYEYKAQNGVDNGTAHVITANAGDTVNMSLTVTNRSQNAAGKVWYGKSAVLPEAGMPANTNWIGLGTARPNDNTPAWLDPSSFAMNGNRFAYYDGAPVFQGQDMTLNFTVKIAAGAANGTYDLYAGVVRDGQEWARQWKNGQTLDTTDVYWRFIVGGGQVTPVGTGSASVSIAGNTPAAGSIVADNTSADGAQALINFANVNFTAGATPSTVTSLMVHRTGVSADADLSNIYLYNGDTRIAEFTSYSAGVATFTNPAGLFTVPANSTWTLSIKGDLANGTSAGKTIALGLNAMSDIILGGNAAVTGTFPAMGNNMTVARVDDLGKLFVQSYTSYPANVNPGQTGLEVWRFNLVGSDQNIQVSKLVLTEVGTIVNTDLQNIKLMVGGVQVGATMQIGTDNTIVFDLSSAPIMLTSGQTKTVVVYADIVGGTSRSFKFTIRKSSDIAAKDMNYNVWLKPGKDTTISDTLPIIQATTGAGTTINNGNLTVTRSTTSPTTTVAKGANGVTLASFDFKATGEAVKVTTVIVGTALTGGTATNNLNNGKLYANGTQVGSTTDFDSAATNDGSYVDGGDDAFTTFNLGNTLIIPAGTTVTVTLVADTTTGSGGILDNTAITVGVGGIVALGQVSLATLSVGTATGNQLTLASGALATSKNLAVANGTSTAPTGVQGSNGVKIGSFLAQAGTGEGVSVTQIVLKDGVTDDAAGVSAGTSTLADAFQNLKVTVNGVMVGSAYATLTDTAATTYSFSVSPAITIAAGQQAVIDVWADIFTTVSANPLADINADSNGIVTLDSVAATGVSTSTTADDTSDRTGQNLYIATSGTLQVVADSGTPAGVLIAGTGTEMTVASFLLKEITGSEGIRITQVVVTDTSSSSTSFSNAKIFIDGVQVGGTVNFSAASNGTATFSGLSYILPANSNKQLVVKATPNAYPNGTAASTHNFTIAANGVTAAGAVSNTATNAPAVAQTSSTHMWARTTLAAANATQGATSGRVRNANDKFQTVTFTSGSAYPAAIRGALQVNDEATATWAISGAGAALAQDSTAGHFVDGSNGIKVTSGATTVSTLSVDTGASSGLQNYSRIGFWLYTTDGGATTRNLVVADSADLVTNPHSVAVTTVSGTLQYVDVAVSSLSGGALTSNSRYIGISASAAGAGTAATTMDNVRVYNDSVKVTLTGNLKAALASNGKPVYLKDSSSSIKLIGYANTTVQDTAVVTLVVGDDIGNAAATQAGDLNLSTGGTALDLIFSDIDQVLVDAGATAEALTSTINLGTATSAGDIRWYDGAVTATSPLTFVNGSTPLQSSVAFQ